MKKVTRRSWYNIPMPDTVIYQVNTIIQGQPNDIDFLDHKKHPLVDIEITGMDARKTEAPHIELV